MITEKVRCEAGPNSRRKTKEYVRILVNDVVQPLEFCNGLRGLCELDAFVESQGYAKNDGEGDFEKVLALMIFAKVVGYMTVGSYV